MPDPRIQLRAYDNAWYNPGGSAFKRALWFFCGAPLVRCSLIPSSAVRVWLLRMFGASIGRRVVIKPSVQVKYPWHLVVGDDCWIGEHVWIDNLTTVSLGSNVCLSQAAYICTGNHDWTDPHFGLIIAPVRLADGAWAGARCILAPGTELGIGAIASAGAVVSGRVPEFQIYAGNPAQLVKTRVLREAQTKISVVSNTNQYANGAASPTPSAEKVNS